MSECSRSRDCSAIAELCMAYEKTVMKQDKQLKILREALGSIAAIGYPVEDIKNPMEVMLQDTEIARHALAQADALNETKEREE